jgi:hypothetical protein
VSEVGMAAQPNTWPVRPIAAPCRARGCYCQLKLLVGRIDGLPTPGRTPRIDRSTTVPPNYKPVAVDVSISPCSYLQSNTDRLFVRVQRTQYRVEFTGKCVSDPCQLPTEATMTMTRSPGTTSNQARDKETKRRRPVCTYAGQTYTQDYWLHTSYSSTMVKTEVCTSVIFLRHSFLSIFRIYTVLADQNWLRGPSMANQF